MAQICPRCSRGNPLAAAYCYFDGMPLGDHTAPGAGMGSAARPFPNPFIFPSGQACHTFDQFALACVNNWKEALQYLESGDVANFMAGLGRADLALAAREAARFPDHERGLEQFLEKLPTHALPAPQLQVEPTQVNLGLLTVGKDSRFELRLANGGMGLLHGSVAFEACPWLSLGDKPGVRQKLFQFLRDTVIPVRVVGKQLRASNKPLEAMLTVESNGSNVIIPIKAAVPVKPFPTGVLAGARNPRQVAEKAKARPKEAAALFEQGAVAAWYRDNGWSYPVPGPCASGIAAVQQFFEALGLTTPPKVDISEPAVNLLAFPGQPASHTLRVTARENRPVYAHAVSDSSWLQVSGIQLEGRSASIHLSVPPLPSPPVGTLQARVTVTTNGKQRFIVPVTLGVAGFPGAGVTVTRAVSVASPTATVPRGALATMRMTPEAASAALAERTAAPPRKEVLAPRRRLGCLPLVPVAFLVVGLMITVARDLGAWMFGAPGPSPVENTASREPAPGIAVEFHDTDVDVTLGTTGVKPAAGQAPGANDRPAIWVPSMRFGLVKVPDPSQHGFQPEKKLTFEERGLTNNTCIRLDGHQWLFGERPFHTPDGKEVGNWPGQWEAREIPLGKDASGKPRNGRKSVWLYPQQQVAVTQTVEVVTGTQTGAADTCLVRYRLDNRDTNPHRVGIRFLLDTYIGENDGVPFLIPGRQQLCSTSAEFNSPDEVPDFIQARETDDLTKPGTIAHLQLKLGGNLEPPNRVTLGAWPNPRLAERNRLCQQEKTLWEVPVFDIHTLDPDPDSAVAIYWNEKVLQPGQSREVGFSYGLGQVAGGEGGGKLAVTVGGSFLPGGEFTVTAYVQNPVAGQTVTLTLPSGFQLVQGTATQPVPPLPADAASRTSPVTWRVKGPSREGNYSLKVQSSTGVSQTQPIRIQVKGIFGNN
jgi:hypothetical protein